MLLQQEIRQVLDTLPFLDSIPREEWSHCDLIRAAPYTPHAIQEGHLLEHAMFILQGRIRIYKFSEQGKEVTLYRVETGQSCVLMIASILGDMPYEANAEVETESTVLLIPKRQFIKWTDQYKSLRQHVYKQMIHRMTAVTDRLEETLSTSIRHRLGNYLLQKTSNQDSRIMMTHERIAVELGTAREVVSRALKELQHKGAVRLRRAQIQVLDQNRILEWSNADRL